MNHDVKRFVDTVNEMMSKGFVLVGGMAVTEADIIVKDEPQVGIVYHQAMVQIPRVSQAPPGLQIPRGVG